MSLQNTDIPINYTKEAFTHPINLGVLLVATILGFVAGTVDIPPSLVLSMVCASELLYLGVVPRLPHFRRFAKLKKLNEKNAESNEKELFNNLGDKDKRQFLVLRHLADLTEQNFEQLPYSSQGLLDNIRTKVEELLADYLSLLDQYNRYKLYNNTAHEEQLNDELREEQEEIRRLKSEQLKRTKARRVRILKKRLKKFELAKEKYLVCETHLETIEDAIRFIYEQSMTMNNPEEIGLQLDNLLSEMEETSALIYDLDRKTLSDEPDLDEVVLDAELEKAQQQKSTSQRIKE